MSRVHVPRASSFLVSVFLTSMSAGPFLFFSAYYISIPCFAFCREIEQFLFLSLFSFYGEDITAVEGFCL